MMMDKLFSRKKLYKGKVDNNPEITQKKRETKCSNRILIVDDEATIRETFAAILTDYGYKVDVAKDGYDAIETVKRKAFNIAFIDIVLNSLNGVETFKIIKKINPNIICIMMTAYSIESMVKHALKRGAYTCIYKPFDMDEIINLIEKVKNNKLD